LRVKGRVTGLLAGRGITRPPMTLHLAVHQDVWLDDPRWQARMIAVARRERYAAIFFDPLRGVTGMVDQGNGSPTEPFSRVQLADVGMGKKLSLRAQQLATVPAPLIKFSALKRLGELSRDMANAPGARGNPVGRGARIVKSQEGTAQPTLADLGISRKVASIAQQLVTLPSDRA
jgi:hypothetical protein